VCRIFKANCAYFFMFTVTISDCTLSNHEKYSISEDYFKKACSLYQKIYSLLMQDDRSTISAA